MKSLWSMPGPDEAGVPSGVPARSLSLAIALGLALYFGMVALADPSAVGRVLSAFSLYVWGSVIALCIVSYLARFGRWCLFLASLGHAIPPSRNLAIYLSGFALTLTPGKAGEAIRSVYLRPEGVGYPASLGSLVAERMLDVCAVGLLASIAFLRFPQQGFLAVGVVLCCLALIVLCRSKWMPALLLRLARKRRGQDVARTVETVGFLLSGNRLGRALPLSFVAWSAQGLALYIIVSALGYGMPVTTVVAIYCLSILAGAASFVPGGLGTTEIVLTILLTMGGMSQSHAVAAALVSRGLTLWLAVGLGLVAMSTLALASRPRPADPSHAVAS